MIGGGGINDESNKTAPPQYEVLDSVSSLTAFALNSAVYLVPFAMVPSSPIELGEMRNKNQFISTGQRSAGGMSLNVAIRICDALHVSNPRKLLEDDKE